MRVLLALACTLGPSTARADELASATLNAVKAATVFVRVDAGSSRATGSGFVIRRDGDTVFALTNHHVVAPDAEKDKSKPARSAPLGKVTLVFRSGTAAERAVPADIIATDAGRDLAVLRARNVVNAPEPIDLRPRSDVIETMTVYTFGFPFGQKLALGQPTPAVTVGKASVSSLRLERGELRFVQLEGELNPGNSGGPVVDGQGRLIGVAVGKVQDTRIALAIGRPQIDHVLRPRVSRATVFLREAQGGTEVGFDVRLYDPAGVIRTATLGIARSAALRSAGATDDLGKVPGGKVLPLQLNGSAAAGSFASSSPVSENEFPFAWQIVLTDADGKSIRGDPAKPPPTTFRRGGVRVEPTRKPLADAELAAALADVPAKELSKSVSALRRLAFAAPQAGQRADVLAVVKPALASESNVVRLEAAKALRSWAARDAVPPLNEMLKDDATDVRFAVLDLLGELRDPRSAEAVAGCLERDREKASRVLKAIGRPATNAVVPFLQNKSLAVRAEACKLLKEFGGPECREALQAATRDADPLVAQFATEALRAVTGRR